MKMMLDFKTILIRRKTGCKLNFSLPGLDFLRKECE